MTILKLVKFQLIKLFSSCRFWIGLLVIFLQLTFHFTIPAFCQLYEIKISPWIMPHLLNIGNATMIGLMSTVIFCDAPFTDTNELFCLMRVNRTKWFASRILFILSVAIILPIIYYLFTLIAIAPSVAFVNEWGDFYSLISQSMGLYSKVHVSLPVSYDIIINYSPLGATLISSWLLTLGIFTLGTIILTLNIYVNRIVGSSISAFLCYLSSFNTGLPLLTALSTLSPVIWCQLSNIKSNGVDNKLLYILIFNAILIILSYLKFRKADINIFESI